MKPKYDNVTHLQLLLFYGCFASFSMGIKIQQITLILFVLFQLGLALSRGTNLGAVFGKGRRAAAFFYGFAILSAVIAQFKFPTDNPIKFHWAFGAVWAIAPSIIPKIRWEWLHRGLVAVSIPGILFSLYWLLQPEELLWAWEKGFHMYPRAEGFVSNPITNAEGLVIIACWSLARLNNHIGPRERKWIYVHLILSIVVIVFSRVRAGLVGFTALFLLNAFLSSKMRKFSLAAWLGMAGVFIGAISIFGFNTASIQERLVLVQQSWELFLENPLFGIGPNRFDHVTETGMVFQQHPHNTFLGIMTESGLFGLSAYLIFMGVVAGQLWRLRRRHRDPEDPLRWVTQGFLCVFVCYWVFGMFDYNFADTELLIFHALHWSLIAGMVVRTVKPGKPAPQTEPS